MTQIHETAYPRIRSQVSERELTDIYTPSREELAFAHKYARESIPKLRLLVLLKAFKRLGYFPKLDDIPRCIIKHIAQIADIDLQSVHFEDYTDKNYRSKHTSLIRSLLQINPYSQGGYHIMRSTLIAASQSKDIIADIINAGIEELVRKHYELPAFSTIRRAAYDARAATNKLFYKQIAQALNPQTKNSIIKALLIHPEGETKSPWNRLKEEPKPPTPKNIRDYLHHLKWLQQFSINPAVFNRIPEAKINRFADEARALDLGNMNKMTKNKRLTIAAALICKSNAQALDDLAEMFIRSMQNLHSKAKEALDQYRDKHQDRTDSLIERLRQIAVLWKAEKKTKNLITGINRIFGDDVTDTLKQCDEHLVYANNNAAPFCLSPYKSKRSNLFRFVENVKLKSTTSDMALKKAIVFLFNHRDSKKNYLIVGKVIKDEYQQLLNLSWIPERWWKLVTGTTRRDAEVLTVDRRYFELCVFSCVMLDLKSGDLYIEGSKKFNDYRKELISWEEYNDGIDLFCEQIGIPKGPHEIIGKLQSNLESKIQKVDASFPSNDSVTFKNGQFILRKVQKQPVPEGFQTIDDLISQDMPQINILDILADTEHWLKWTSKFGPVSGFEAKVKDPEARYISTTFCYGCYLGPTQTANSLKDFDRRQISYINQHHVDEDKIQSIIVDVINLYNRFNIIKNWGSGKSAAADGTKWDIYEQNLLSEYHIRYGGWGGIGYYHVSDTYIALFSNFIPCGVWEGIHILDIFKNPSDIQPVTLHGDTQAQSVAVFGLAYLLGIKLMPRIRKWKNLNFYLPYKKLKLEHIENLFAEEPINWKLIETHLPDMLRVALSVSKGRITPSTILRKLGTYSRKNKLYFAFKELGRVIRTIFLLNYISDIELRRTINAATNVNEAWNGFIQWVAFGQNGKVPGDTREEQRKAIKYNHLVSNLIVFHNAVMLTNIIDKIRQEGKHEVTNEIIALLSPYRTKHINRFGTYELRLDREPPPLPGDSYIS